MSVLVVLGLAAALFGAGFLFTLGSEFGRDVHFWLPRPKAQYEDPDFNSRVCNRLKED